MQVSCILHLTSDSGQQISVICRMSAVIWHLTSDIWHLTSDVWLGLADISEDPYHTTIYRTSLVYQRYISIDISHTPRYCQFIAINILSIPRYCRFIDHAMYFDVLEISVLLYYCTGKNGQMGRNGQKLAKTAGKTLSRRLKLEGSKHVGV